MSKLKDPDEFLLQSDNLDVDEFDDELNDETFGDPIGGDLNDDWEAAQDQYNDKLERCIEEMQKVVGQRIAEVDLRIAASKCNYDCAAALSSLLSEDQIEQLKRANERQPLPNKTDTNGLIAKKPPAGHQLSDEARDDDLIKNTLDRVASHQLKQLQYQLMQQMQQQLRGHQAPPPPLPLLMNAQQPMQQFPSDLQSPRHFIPFPSHQFIPPHLQQFMNQNSMNSNASNLGNSTLSDSFASMNLNNNLGNLNPMYAQLQAESNGFNNAGNPSNLNSVPMNLRSSALTKSDLDRQLNPQLSTNSFLNGSVEPAPVKRALTLEEIEQGMLEEKKSVRNDEPKKLTLEDLESSLLSDSQPRSVANEPEDNSFGFNINNLSEFPSLDSNQFPKITKTQAATVQAASSSNENRPPQFNQFNPRNNYRPNPNHYNPHNSQYNSHSQYNQNRQNPNFRNAYHPSLIPNPLNPLEMISNTMNGSPSYKQQQQQQQQQVYPNKPYNNRNYRNYYQQSPFHNRSNEDEYAGLMTPKDINWLRRIQHMQLEFDDPYVQDYYFVNYQAKKIASELKKRDRMNGEMHSVPQLVIPERGRIGGAESTTDTARYVPPDFSGSLGKIRVANVNEPRKLLDFNNKLQKLAAKSESVSIEPQGRVELNKFRRLLLDIEHNLTNVLKIDHEDKKMAALPADAQIPHREERKRLCNELFTGILTTDDNKNVNFHIANIRKGCMLIFKALQVLEEPEQKTIIIADLLKVDNFHHVVMQKDKTLYCLDYGQVLIDSIKTIRNCDFEYLLRIADGLDDASVVAKFQCGQEIIEVLLKQYAYFDVHDKDQKLKWLSFLERVLEDVDDIPHLRKLCNDHIVALTGQ